MANATKCFVNAQGFYLHAEVVPGLRGTSYVLHVNCGGHAALTVTASGKAPVRKEWYYTFIQLSALIDAVNESAFYELPERVGDVLPAPDAGWYTLNLYRDLERHHVAYYPQFNVANPEKTRFMRVWNVAFKPSGTIPPLP